MLYFVSVYRFKCLDVHVDSGTIVIRGFIQVWGSQTSENLIKLVEKRKLESYLEWIHIILDVMDGVAVMMKLCQLNPCEHVCASPIPSNLDVFFRKTTPPAIEDHSSG